MMMIMMFDPIQTVCVTPNSSERLFMNFKTQIFPMYFAFATGCLAGLSAEY